MYKSTKTYGSNLGLSAAFRQWRATSHCQYVHGYSLGFRFVFQATNLDARNWVVDFGGLKELKNDLEKQFDHKLLVAQDDPALENFLELSRLGLVQLNMMKNVGCEAFAEWALNTASQIVNDKRVQVISCECFEHGANSAICEAPFFLF